jgi:deoxycytidylate deaminase
LITRPVAFIFNVTEHRRTDMAGLFGDTILDQGRIIADGLNEWVRSMRRLRMRSR